MSNRTAEKNQTNLDASTDALVWKAESIVLTCIVTVICIATILYNILIIIVFIRKSALRTPFGYYVLNVAVADLNFAVFNMVDFIYYTLRNSGVPLGKGCPFYQLIIWVAAPAACYAIMLISFERVWSLFLPTLYRDYHSNKFSVRVCAVMWLLLIALNIPYISIETMWYHAPDDVTCGMNFEKQRTYSLVLEVVANDLPLILILVNYALLFVKIKRRRRVRFQGKGDYPSKCSYLDNRANVDVFSQIRARNRLSVGKDCGKMVPNFWVQSRILETVRATRAVSPSGSLRVGQSRGTISITLAYHIIVFPSYQ